MKNTKEKALTKLLEIEEKLSFLFNNLVESYDNGNDSEEQKNELDAIVFVYNQIRPLILNVVDLYFGEAIKSLITKQINLFNGGINSYAVRNKIEFPDDLSKVNSLAFYEITRSYSEED